MASPASPPSGTADGTSNLDAAPLPLPAVLSKATFYISPLANPDLVLALFLPGHPLYSGQALPHTPSETRLREATASPPPSKGFGSSISHFFGAASNVVTNTAAHTIGVKNYAEFNKPKLRLVPRALVSGPSAAQQHLNQRWMISKDDGCIYSCVEERDNGGSYYRLGLSKNQMVRVRARDVVQGESNLSPTKDVNTNPARDPASTTNNSLESSANSVNSTASDPMGTSTISVTTASGGVVVCPSRWEVQKPVTSDQVKNLIHINGIHVVIEDLEAPASGLLQALPSISLSSKSSSTADKDLNRLLVIKNVCCGNLECELEKIDVGSSCGFKSREKENVGPGGVALPPARSPSASSSSASSTSSNSGNGNGNGSGKINLKQVWRIESDYGAWMSTLSRSVSTEYNLTRKLQTVEEHRRRVREATPDPATHVPMKLTIDYEYKLVWSTEGTKAAHEASIWRPVFPAGANYYFMGDFMHDSLRPPTKKESLVVASSATLHRGIVRPVDFELVYTKTKGKHGSLFVWCPLPPPGVDAIALGHIAVAGKKEEKPRLDCGVVLVLREYLRDTGHSLSTPIWNDTGVGGGAIGSFWSAKHCFTFFCNPGSHAPPLGSYYALLDPASLPEKCPLLRPMEPLNVGWTSVWNDQNTFATMDISVWRPVCERAYVRFGDLVVRGHAAPKHLAIVAKDHPAFRRPKAYRLLTKFYRGAKKCYVYQPIPPDENYVALGCIVMPTKEEVPALDLIRCVHKDALIPLGVMKQMWLEHHNGMMSTLTLGVTNFINLSKEGVVNMLFKNRSLNTFVIVQNSHARPEGEVYRLTMTESELARTVGSLEKHARWVLESFLLSLTNVAQTLIESNYERLSLSPRQVAAIFQSIQTIFKYLRESDGDATAFSLSSTFAEYLRDYERTRLRLVYGTFKRYIYQSVCADIKTDLATETLDRVWPLLKQMTEVNRTDDKVDEWEPKLQIRLAAHQSKSLINILMDELIGKEIFERFLTEFPPRIGHMTGMDDDNEEQAEPVLTRASSQAGMTPAGSATLAPNAKPEVDNEAQREAVKGILERLSGFSAQLDDVIGTTAEAEIRKLYLERFQQYLTHTIEQEFPVHGSTARLAATNEKLTMSSLLQIVSWMTAYQELVEQDLLEGDRSVACQVLAQMDDLIDKFMDAHDEYAKVKILSWIGNILRQEERADVELVAGGEDDTKKGLYYYTSGPVDLFNNITTLFDAQSADLTGRPLARIALMNIHVITYYQQVQNEYWKQVQAIRDGTTHDTVKGRTPLPTVKHAGSTLKPYCYVLAQINNSRLYQSNIEELGEKVLQRLGADDAPDELVASLEDAFALCSEEFQTLALGATEILIRHIAQHLQTPFAQVLSEKVWFAEADYFQTAVIDELDELCSFFIPNIEQGIYAVHLLQESAKQLVAQYLRMVLRNLKPSSFNATFTPAAVAKRIRVDGDAIREYGASIKRWNILDSVERPLKQLDLIADFLSTDAGFLKIHISEAANVFREATPSSPTYTADAAIGQASGTPRTGHFHEFSPAIMTQHLLSLRADVPAEDKRLWLQPYAAELKAYEQAQKHALLPRFHRSGVSVSNPTPGSAIGSTPYGLEIQLLKGMDLAVKDSTTSDPYVKMILLAPNGERIERLKSKTIEKTLYPVWNEMHQFAPSGVGAFERIRFEVWDWDRVGTDDFMGYAEVTLDELRNKQLLERKTSVSKTSVEADYTQDPINFHLKLLPREGRQNVGSDMVSGFIDLRIRYFKMSGMQWPTAVAAPAPAKGKGSAASSMSDFFADGVDDVGTTGARRGPRADSVGANASPSSDVTPMAINVVPPAGEPLASSAAVMQQIESSGPKWTDIVGSIKLAKSTDPLSPSAAGSSASARSPSAAPRKSIMKSGPMRTRTILPVTRGVTINADKKLTAPTGEQDATATSPRKKTLKKGDSSHADFFGLF